LKRVIAICTPVVEENPRFVELPPPFTAKGVRVDPRIRRITLTSSAEPGSTEQADAWVLDRIACSMSNEY
jgi:hypothetical protein